MALEKKATLERWLPLLLAVITVIGSAVYAFARVEATQEAKDRVDAAQWRRIDELETTVGGVREEIRAVGGGVDELRFNVRRMMEDGGVRYIERGR